MSRYTFLYRKNIKKAAIKLSSILKWVPDAVYLKLLYYARTGKKLNLKNPKRFNEKIQWIKIYDHDPLYTMLADKYRVKDYIEKKIGAEYIIPTLGVWDSFEEIDFDKLPDQFVLKCNHDSGGLVICKDKSKLDMVKAKEKIEYCLKKNYFYQNREWAYKNIKRVIIAEKYMEDHITKDIQDYKFMCFGGKVQCIFVCSERYSGSGLKVTFFDTDWNVLPFERHYMKSSVAIEKPQNLRKMIALSEKLSEGIRFVRVDLYEINGQVYFGEMTFYPGSGMEEFRPDEWDYTLGDWIDIC